MTTDSNIDLDSLQHQLDLYEKGELDALEKLMPSESSHCPSHCQDFDEITITSIYDDLPESEPIQPKNQITTKPEIKIAESREKKIPPKFQEIEPQYRYKEEPTRREENSRYREKNSRYREKNSRDREKNSRDREENARDREETKHKEESKRREEDLRRKEESRRKEYFLKRKEESRREEELKRRKEEAARQIEVEPRRLTSEKRKEIAYNANRLVKLENSLKQVRQVAKDLKQDLVIVNNQLDHDTRCYGLTDIRKGNHVITPKVKRGRKKAYSNQQVKGSVNDFFDTVDVNQLEPDDLKNMMYAFLDNTRDRTKDKVIMERKPIS